MTSNTNFQVNGNDLKTVFLTKGNSTVSDTQTVYGTTTIATISSCQFFCRQMIVGNNDIANSNIYSSGWSLFPSGNKLINLSYSHMVNDNYVRCRLTVQLFTQGTDVELYNKIMYYSATSANTHFSQSFHFITPSISSANIYAKVTIQTANWGDNYVNYSTWNYVSDTTDYITMNVLNIKNMNSEIPN